MTSSPPGPPAAVDLAGPSPVRVGLADVDPDVVAALAVGCPAVAGLSGGPFGAATYLPGRRVSGVRLSDTAVEVHAVLARSATVPELAAQLRRVLSGRVGGRRVDVVVEDVEDDLPAEPLL